MLLGEGIDRADELLDLGLDQGAITRTDSGYRLGSTRLGYGREDARRFLGDHPDLVGCLRKKLLSNLGRNNGKAA
jgi:recombination protein RecA